MKDLKFRAWVKNYNCYADVLGFEQGRLFVQFQSGERAQHRLYVPIEDCVLEQYTGLKGKNGKEIYENDMVEYTTCYYGKEKRHRKVVEWSEWDSDDFGEPHNIGYYNLSECMAVIGNVHENADLLEEK